MLEGSYGDTLEPTVYPTPEQDPIKCFSINELITLTAKPAGGNQFLYWDFNYWPNDLNEPSDKNKNPLTFTNTYLKGDGLADSYDAIRSITAYFTYSNSTTSPSAPENLNASDGTETEKVSLSWDFSQGATYYEIFRAEYINGTSTQIGTIERNFYEDSSVISDNIYYYWVRAFNQYGSSPYSASDSGYAFIDDEVPTPPTPPTPVYEPEEISPLEAKQKLDTDLDVIILDVSALSCYDTAHILCAISNPWNSLIDTLNYRDFVDYKDFPILIYAQDTSTSKFAADYLAKKGFSEVYYMLDGLQQWIANGWETVDSDFICECSLPPIALAGDDASADENTSVILDASGSEALGNGSLTYEWRQAQGTEAFMNSPSLEKTSITTPYVQEGGEQLIFHVIVTDSDKNQDTDSVAVDVTWHNSPPVADAGDDQYVPENDPVLLTSASSDRDSGIDTYQWKQISGKPEVELTNSTSETLEFTTPNLAINADQTELVFELTVTDKGELSDTDEVSVFVCPKNTLPVADAGSDATVKETHIVELNAAGSYDPDMDDAIESYLWTQTAGPTVTLSSHSAVNPTFTAPEVLTDAITLAFELTVTDQCGDQGIDEIIVTVTDAGDPPIADAGTDQKLVYPGWKVFLDGSASSDDDGEIMIYEWEQISGTVVILAGTGTAKPELVVPDIDQDSEQLIFQLTVTDDKNLKNSDQIKVVVAKSEEPPVANAGIDQEVREKGTVYLDASASSDADDGIETYAWHQTGGTPSVTLTDSATDHPEFPSPDIDEKEVVLAFELTVTDYSGKTATDEVKITIRKKNSDDSTCFISTLN